MRRRPITDEQALKYWEFWYTYSATSCLHGKNCARRKQGWECDFGCRHKRKHIITGAILPIWKVRRYCMPACLPARCCGGGE